MRVVAGEFRGRRLAAPEGLDVRPTPDRVREALFDILGPRVKGSVFLDLFAGSGANGIEALSRGAATVALVESAREALRSLESNLVSLGIEGRVALYKASWPWALQEAARSGPFSIVFADPPFAHADYARVLESVTTSGVLAPDGLVALEHEAGREMPAGVGELRHVRLARYGRVGLSFYSRPG